MSYCSDLFDADYDLINPVSSQWSIVYQPHNVSVFYDCLIYFVIGLLLAPWTDSIVFLILLIIIYELLVAVYRRKDLFNYTNGYYLFDRLAISMSSILGFIVGRTLLGDVNLLQSADEFSFGDLMFWSSYNNL